MPILAEYKEGKFIPLEKVKLSNGEIVELDLLPKKDIPKQHKLVSLDGMAKLLVSEKELDKSIEEAKRSLSKGADDVLRS